MVRKALVGSQGHLVVLRSSIIYGPPSITGKHSFLKFLHDGVTQNKRLELFSDEFRSPVFVGDVVQACLAFSRMFLG